MPTKKDFYKTLYIANFDTYELDDNVNMDDFLFVGDSNWDHYFASTSGQPDDLGFEELHNVYVSIYKNKEALNKELDEVPAKHILDLCLHDEVCFALTTV